MRCPAPQPGLRTASVHMAARVLVTTAPTQPTPPPPLPPVPLAGPTQGPSKVKKPLPASQSRAVVTSSAREDSKPWPAPSDLVWNGQRPFGDEGGVRIGGGYDSASDELDAPSHVGERETCGVRVEGSVCSLPCDVSRKCPANIHKPTAGLGQSTTATFSVNHYSALPLSVRSPSCSMPTNLVRAYFLSS